MELGDGEQVAPAHLEVDDVPEPGRRVVVEGRRDPFALPRADVACGRGVVARSGLDAEVSSGAVGRDDSFGDLAGLAELVEQLPDRDGHGRHFLFAGAAGIVSSG